MARDRYRKGHCGLTGKVRFRDHREAVKALHGCANSRRVAAELALVSQREEVRCYQCGACSGWHLTSWVDPMTPKNTLRHVTRPSRAAQVRPLIVAMSMSRGAEVAQ